MYTYQVITSKQNNLYIKFHFDQNITGYTENRRVSLLSLKSMHVIAREMPGNHQTEWIIKLKEERNV